jgi:hypothetical protein
MPLLAGTELAGFWHCDPGWAMHRAYDAAGSLPVKGSLREWKRNNYSGGGNSKDDQFVFDTLQMAALSSPMAAGPCTRRTNI